MSHVDAVTTYLLGRYLPNTLLIWQTECEGAGAHRASATATRRCLPSATPICALLDRGSCQQVLLLCVGNNIIVPTLRFYALAAGVPARNANGRSRMMHGSSGEPGVDSGVGARRRALRLDTQLQLLRSKAGWSEEMVGGGGSLLLKRRAASAPGILVRYIPVWTGAPKLLETLRTTAALPRFEISGRQDIQMLQEEVTPAHRVPNKCCAAGAGEPKHAPVSLLAWVLGGLAFGPVCRVLRFFRPV